MTDTPTPTDTQGLGVEGVLDEMAALAKTMINSHKLVGPYAFFSNAAAHKAWADSRYADGKKLRALVQAARQSREAGQ